VLDEVEGVNARCLFMSLVQQVFVFLICGAAHRGSRSVSVESVGGGDGLLCGTFITCKKTVVTLKKQSKRKTLHGTLYRQWSQAAPCVRPTRSTFMDSMVILSECSLSIT
jgi:hypothetical protein